MPRRLREACADTPVEVIADQQRAVQNALAAAARAAGSTTDPDAIAEALESRPADSWSQTELEAVREAAFEIARQLRSIVAAAPDAD
jgi:hypothetical protein